MRHLLSVIALGALASISFGQNTITRFTMPRLSGAASSELIKSVKGPQGSTYSLLAGVDSLGSQVIGVARQTANSNKTILAELPTGISSDFDKHNLNLSLDTQGNAYVMYDRPENRGDIAITKVSPTNGIVWTSIIASQWRDINWELHPTADKGTSMQYDPTRNSVYVLSQRTAGTPVANAIINRLAPSTGNITFTSFFDLELVSPGKLTVDASGNANIAFGAIIPPDPDAEDQTLFSSLIMAKFAPNGTQVYGTFFSSPTETDAFVYDVNTGSDDSLLIAGGLTFVDNKGGLPYFSQAQLAVKLDTMGAGVFIIARRELDAFARPGQINPHVITPDTAGGAYIAGGVNTYADPMFRGYVEHLDGFGTDDLGVKTSEDYGDFWSLAIDGYSNVYVGGYKTVAGAGGLRSRAVANKYDPALNLEDDFVFLRTEYSLGDPTGYIPSKVNVQPAGVDVFPVTKGNPTFAVNEGLQENGTWINAGALLQVKDNPEVLGIALESASVLAGYNAKLTITLDRQAPDGGFKVRIASTNENVFPSRFVTVPQGKKVGTFEIKTPALTESGSTTLLAGPNFMLSTALTVNPIGITLSTNKKALLKFDTFWLTVTLADEAPVGGLSIPLKSSNKDLIPVPTSIKVGAGKKEAKVELSVLKEVNANTTVTFSAGPGFTATTSVTVIPAGVLDLTLSKDVVFGGNSVVATVRLSGPAPAGAKLKLTSSIPDIHVPASVNITTGATSVVVNVQTDPVNVAKTGTISATWNSTARATLTLTAVEVASISADAQVLGGKQLFGTVTLTRVAPAGGAPVTITSDKAAIPSTEIVIPEGQKTAGFAITTMPVTQDTETILIASTTDLTARTQTVVKAPKVLTVSFDPATVKSGEKTVMTITLNGVAPQGGLVINLATSDNSALPVPPTVTVPGGAKSVKVNLGGGVVAQQTTVVVTATLNGVGTNANVIVKP